MLTFPNTKLLQAFEAIARHGSVTVAARELCITQSALSRQLKSLEILLDVKFFVRQKNRLCLTEAGRELHQVLHKKLSEINDCIEHLQAGPRYRVTVKTPPSFATRWLAPRLVTFYEQSKCAVSLYTDGSSPATSGSTAFGGYDCEVFFGHSGMAALNGKLLFEELIQPVCAPVLLDKIRKEGINSVPILHTLSGITPLPYWEYWMQRSPDSSYVPSLTALNSGMEFSTQEQAMNAAIEGLGVVMLDTNLGSLALKKKLLITLGEPVTTPFKYWFEETSPGQSEMAKAFCEWISKEALLCYM